MEPPPPPKITEFLRQDIDPATVPDTRMSPKLPTITSPAIVEHLSSSTRKNSSSLSGGDRRSIDPTLPAGIDDD
jgi:hypothetical protein